MDISLLNILRTVSWDFRRDMAQSYANGLKKAIEVHIDNDVEKEQGYFLSKKGLISKENGKRHAANFEDKLYVGNIHSIEDHLYWNDEELADDDQVINVIKINGPVTRDGGACSYGTKDWRDQILYADTIPQVIGHLFIVNSPGGESACRKDYDLMMEDWRAHKKPAVMYVDGMACSSLVNLGCRCDRVVVRNPKDDFGSIGSMAALWATPDGAKDVDGSRYIEIVGDNAPEKNDWYRNAAEGDYEKLKAVINKDTDEFRQTVRDNRPLVEDWMLSGNVFEAQQVMPALVDEIGTLDRAIECVFELADGKLTPAREAKKEPKVEPDPQKEPDPDPDAQPAPEDPEDEPESNQKINNNMTEDKKEELATIEQSDAEQVSASPEETPQGEKPDNNEDAQEKKNEEPNDDTNIGENCGNNDTPGKDEAATKAIIANLDNKIRAKDKAIAEKEQEINNLKTMLEKSKKQNNDAIAQLKMQIAELHKEVKELASEPTPMTEGAEAPKDNGTGVPETGTVKSVVTADMSADEIRKRLREQDKAIATKRRRM